MAGGALKVLKGLFTLDMGEIVDGLHQMWDGYLAYWQAIWDGISGVVSKGVAKVTSLLPDWMKRRLGVSVDVATVAQSGRPPVAAPDEKRVPKSPLPTDMAQVANAGVVPLAAPDGNGTPRDYRKPAFGPPAQTAVGPSGSNAPWKQSDQKVDLTALIRFENAPAGLRVGDVKSSDPKASLSVDVDMGLAGALVP